MQDDISDDKLCTSEAIFVFTQTFPDVFPGDQVLVSGMVDEYQPGEGDNGNLWLSQIINVEIRVQSSGHQLPEPILIGGSGLRIPDKMIDDDGFKVFDPEDDGIDFYESLESMLVRIESGVVVGPRNQYNEIVIITNESIEKNVISSNGALIQQEFDANPERIILNLNDENQKKVNVGAELTHSVTGILDYSYGNYKVNVFGIASFTNGQQERMQFEGAENSLIVATYNVENLSRFDETRMSQLAETIDNHLNNPDILVLHEILDDSGVEDDGEVSSELTLTRLVNLIEDKGGVEYEFVDNPPKNNQDGGIEGGNIRSVILFRADTTKIADAKEGNLTTNPARIGPDNWPFSVTRKPLVVLFDYKGSKFLVVALHFTSRGADTPLFGNRQPIVKPEQDKRIAQAMFVSEYLQTFHLRNLDLPIIVAGDLNDDPWSTTLQVLKGRLLTDLTEKIPENERFSYIVDGNAVQLDYLILTENSGWTVSPKILHSNSLYDHTLQTSDHDPVVAEILIP